MGVWNAVTYINIGYTYSILKELNMDIKNLTEAPEYEYLTKFLDDLVQGINSINDVETRKTIFHRIKNSQFFRDDFNFTNLRGIDPKMDEALTKRLRNLDGYILRNYRQLASNGGNVSDYYITHGISYIKDYIRKNLVLSTPSVNTESKEIELRYRYLSEVVELNGSLLHSVSLTDPMYFDENYVKWRSKNM